MAKTVEQMCAEIERNLGQLEFLPERAISMAEKSLKAQVPGGWAVFGPAIFVEPTPTGGLALQVTEESLQAAAARLQANGGILRKRYGLSSGEYIFWDRRLSGKEISSEPFPVRIEAEGAPDGTANPGMGKGLWKSTAAFVGEFLREEMRRTVH